MRVVITADTASDRPAMGIHDSEQPEIWDVEAIIRDTEATIEDAGGKVPVFRGFLSSLSDGESPFSVLSYKVWSAKSDSESEPLAFASRVDLTISQSAQSLDRQQYADFAAGLAKLLEHEPGDALMVELQIASVRFPDGRQGFCLAILLVARGTGPDQARLRWSLGLARIQQALLFEARALRQGRF